MPKKTFYITTAIDYPNSLPHVGHAYEKIIADALVRWHRLKGENVYFLTGTDENAQKIEQAAKEAGKDVKAFVDENSKYFRELCKKLNISNNDFIRTTEERHKKIAQLLFKKVYGKGDIYKGLYEGLYCYGCEAYYTEKDLADGKCPEHKKEAVRLREESYFFKLSKYEDKIRKHIEENPEFIQPEANRNEILQRLKEGLKDLSCSRKTTKWGIPLPTDKSHVIYVWFDALANYITALGYPEGEKYKKYWPADVHIIGRNIAWFHTVIWGSILLSAGIPLPKKIHCHGFLTINGEKISKSLGNVIDPIYLADKYGVDALRYFLLREIPAGADGDFSEKELIERVNADLADALGNLLQRTLTLIEKHFNGIIPKPAEFNDADEALVKASDIFKEANQLMQGCEWHRALEKIWDFIKKCNKYITGQEPWKLQENTNSPSSELVGLKSGGLKPAVLNTPLFNKKRLATVLYVLVECLRIISIYTYPFVPETAENLAKQLGQKLGSFKDIKFRKTTEGKTEKAEVLFKKIEKAKAQEEPFARLNLKVAKILDAKPHPNADKLYVLEIDLGAEKRTLVAGIREHYPADELVGKNIVVLTNLKPAKIRNVESRGMLLAAEKDGKLAVLEAPNSEPGEQVFVEGINHHTAQIEIGDFAKANLTTKNKKVIYNGKPLKTSTEQVTVDIEDGARVR